MSLQRKQEKAELLIKKMHSESGMSKAVIGVSGGIDSAVVATLLTKTLGYKNVIGYFLPYGKQEDREDAYEIAKFANTGCNIVNIKPMVDSFKLTNDNLGLGNIKARVRMIILYEMSRQHNALVVGTGNKTELMLGYYTIFGDGACAYEPIGHMFKTEVKELASIIGVPQTIIDKAPSAGLWDGQTDEEDLGISYEQIDKYLAMIDNNKFKSKIPRRVE